MGQTAIWRLLVSLDSKTALLNSPDRNYSKFHDERDVRKPQILGKQSSAKKEAEREN
jgi:hypothetical protein